MNHTAGAASPSATAGINLQKLILGSRIDFLTFIVNPKQDLCHYDDQIHLLRGLTASLPFSADSRPQSRDEIFRKVLAVVCPDTYPAEKTVPIGDLLPSRRGKLAAPYDPYPGSVVEGSILPPHPEPRNTIHSVRMAVDYPSGEKYRVLPDIASHKRMEIELKQKKGAKSGKAIGHVNPPRRSAPVKVDVVVEYQDGSGKSALLSAAEAEAFRDKIVEWVDVCAKIKAKQSKLEKRKRASDDDDAEHQGYASTSAGSRPTKKLRGRSPQTIRIPSRASSVQSIPAPIIPLTGTGPLSPGVIRIPPRPCSPPDSTIVQTSATAGPSPKPTSRRSERLGKDNLR
ncbi:hypothetical protein BJ912DRAFT_994099, partial [Pholiota molesta]